MHGLPALFRNVSLSGNTSGALADVSSGTLYLAGGNNVTLSQNGNSVTISAAAGGGGTNTLGMSNLGNTSGTSGVVTGASVQMLFAGGNNVTLSQSVNGASATLTISAFNQTNQSVGLYGLGNTTQNSSTTLDARSLSLNGLGAVTVGYSNGSIQLSAPVQTVESQSAGISNLGNTSGTSGIASGGQLRLLFAGGNNVTLSQSLNGASGTVTISAFNQTVESQSAGISNLGNTAGTSGIASGGQLRLLLAGGNNVTLSQSLDGASATVTVSAFNQTVESQSIGMSNLGNTSGTSGIASGGQVRFLFAGGDNITLSQSINGASGTITISGAAGGTGGGNQSLGMSNVGNTSGTTGMATGSAVQFVFAGGNNVTLSQSLNGASGTVTISAFNQSAESQSIGISNVGNSSGTSGVASGAQVQFVIAGGNNITLSQSLNGASATVTVSGINPGAQNMNYWQNLGVNGSATDAAATRAVTFDELRLFQLDIGNNIFAGNMTVSTVLLNVSGSASTLSNYRLSAFVGLYTKNGDNLSLINSGSVAFSHSGAMTTNFSQTYNGRRWITMNSSVFSTDLTLSQGLYWGGILYRSSIQALGLSEYGAYLGESGQRSGTFGTTSVSNYYIGAVPLMGVVASGSASSQTVSFSALPASIASGSIRKTALADIFVPHIMFNNNQSSF